MTAPSKRNPKLYEYHRIRDAEAGRPRRMSSAATVRRVRAMAHYGWSAADIARDIGMTQQNFSKSLSRQIIYRSTHDKVKAWYEAHEMTLPEKMTPQRTRTQRAAQRAGWPPPLAWEDVENGVLAEASKSSAYPEKGRFSLDEVEHVWSTRDFSVPLSPLEKAEILRRWRLEGRSDNALQTLTGWRPSRYSPLIPTLHQEAS